MAVRTVIGCDSCGGEPAQALILDLGEGARRIDLCQACQDGAGLARLEALLADYGITGQAKAVGKARRRIGDYPCPQCDYVAKERQLLIAHLDKTHRLGLVEASKLVPPPGVAVTCEQCGYLAQAGQGIAQHRIRAHGGKP